MSIRLGLIGAGAHSRFHGESCAHIVRDNPDRVELAAVCDLDADKARAYADAHGFARTYTDIDAMVDAEQLDAIAVITPVPVTEPVVMQLLPKGIPLLIEKPAGPTIESARRLMEAAREAGTQHMISFNRRFSPVLTRARAWMNEKPDERRPYFVLGRMLRNRRREDSFAPSTGIHLIDATLSFMGRPEKLTTLRKPAVVEERHNFYARATFADGGVVDWVMTPDVGVLEETYEFHGPGFCVKADHLGSSLRIWEDGDLVVSWDLPDDAGRYILEGTHGEMQAFLDYIDDPGLPMPQLSDAVLGVTVGEAIKRGGDATFTEADAGG